MRSIAISCLGLALAWAVAIARADVEPWGPVASVNQTTTTACPVPIILGRPVPLNQADPGPTASNVICAQNPSVPPPVPPPPPPGATDVPPLAGGLAGDEELYNCGVVTQGSTPRVGGVFGKWWEGGKKSAQQFFGPIDPEDPAPRVWASGEYLLWWVQNAPLPVPLVTGNTDPTTIAALNQVGTKILFGSGSGQSTSFGPFSGGRVTLGGWLDSGRRFGLEGSGFLLEQRSILFSAASAGGTAPIVSIPFNATQPFNGNPAGETSLNGGKAPKSVFARVSSHLWGAEANGLLSLFNNGRYRLAALTGFRYLDLTESLALNDVILFPATNGVLEVSDHFGTRNQFYSGQIGVRGGLTWRRLTVDVTAKVAFGANHQTLNIAGATTVTNGAFGFANGTTASGVFAEPSNIGHFSRDVFAVVPEVQFQLAFRLTQNIRPFVGYNFLYLSNALRPGNQIDRNINITQNFLVPPGMLMGPAAPLPSFHSSDFWAHGVNFGVEIRY